MLIIHSVIPALIPPTAFSKFLSSPVVSSFISLSTSFKNVFQDFFLKCPLLRRSYLSNSSLASFSVAKGWIFLTHLILASK
jgi:hypothetical protein